MDPDQDCRSGRVAAVARAADIGLFLCALFFLCAAVSVWFVGARVWEVAGFTITLREWWKPWWIAVGLLLVRSAIRPELPFVISAPARALARAAERSGLHFDSAPARRAAPGFVLAAAFGFVAATHYFYLAPYRAVPYIAAALMGAAGWSIHYAVARAAGAALSALPFNVSGARRSAAVRDVFMVLWSLPITFVAPLSESVVTEPMPGQAAAGLAVGTALLWVLGARWSMGGLFGKARRAALFAAALALAALVFLDAGRARRRQADPSRPRRVILITLDTTRADHVSCYGYDRKTTPNLDRLAARGARFTRAFCVIGLTDPVHASILSGTYPRTHGLQRNFRPLTGDVESMGRVFSERGFVTAAVTSRPRLLPSDMGFEPFKIESGARLYFRRLKIGGFTGFNRELTSAAEAYRRAANILHRRRGEDLFLWAHFFDPHMPYETHEGFSEKFGVKEKARLMGQGFLRPGDREFTAEEIELFRDVYDGELLYMDHWLGELIGLVGRLGEEDGADTTILVMADHGENLGDYIGRPIRHAFGHGGVLYNAVAHIPMVLVREGEIPAGIEVGNIAESVDVAPTLYDYALGLTGAPVQGKSLRAAVEGRDDSAGRAVIMRPALPPEPPPPRAELFMDQYALVEGDYKYFRTFMEGDPAELYNLAEDWDEERDLLWSGEADPARFEETLDGWMESAPAARPAGDALTPEMIEELRALGYIQ